MTKNGKKRKINILIAWLIARVYFRNGEASMFPLRQYEIRWDNLFAELTVNCI